LWMTMLSRSRQEGVELSPGRAALLATQASGKVSWELLKGLPRALLKSLSPSDLHERGLLTDLSHTLSQELDSAPSPEPAGSPSTSDDPPEKPPQADPSTSTTAPPPAALRPGFWMTFCLFLWVINLAMFCLNLFPIPPLDGFRIVRVLVEMVL